jgi:hypothetical protein
MLTLSLFLPVLWLWVLPLLMPLHTSALPELLHTLTPSLCMLSLLSLPAP